MYCVDTARQQRPSASEAPALARRAPALMSQAISAFERVFTAWRWTVSVCEFEEAIEGEESEEGDGVDRGALEGSHLEGVRREREQQRRRRRF